MATPICAVKAAARSDWPATIGDVKSFIQAALDVRTLDPLLKSLFIMGSMVEARDPYTGGHIWRVSQFARRLAEAGGLPPAVVARVALGGFLHDLGKIGVPDAILRKPDQLTDAEFAIIRTHPETGQRLLAEHPLAALVEPAVLGHHERPDGSGYPRGLKGAALSLDARLVGICDAFDAMTSNRPYRRGLPLDMATGIIREQLGRQFDSEWGERFIRLVESGALDGIIGHTEPGIPVQPCPICGPTIVVRHDNREGDLVYCRNCGTEVKVHRQDGQFTVEPTGRKGTAEDLQPEADLMGIHEMLQQFAHPAIHSLKQTFWPHLWIR